MALGVLGLQVKFYASKTKAEALALATLPNEDDREPGAICFVSDNTGNYIIVNGKIFGDGTSGGGGSGGGGAVDSVNGLTGAVILDANDLKIEKDGTSLRTIGDFLKADGTLVGESFKIYLTRTDSLGNEYNYAIVDISPSGIMYDGKVLSTQEWVTSLITSNNLSLLSTAETRALQLANLAETAAKTYTDSVLSSIYKIKGSVDSYSNLPTYNSTPPPKEGDVYNVILSYGQIGSGSYIPPGTNYVYISVTDTNDARYPGYWDPLGGTVDLSNYYTKADVNLIASDTLNSAKDYTDNLDTRTNLQISNIETIVTGLLTNYSTLSSTVSTHGTQISTNTTNINNNTIALGQIGEQLTWQ